MSGFRVTNPILFSITLLVIAVGTVIVFQLLAALFNWLSKIRYKPIEISFPGDSKLASLTFGRGIGTFIIRNRDDYDHLRNCYVKISRVVFPAGNEFISAFAEQVYTRKLMWQNIGLNDGTMTIGKKDEEALNIVELGDKRFRFCFSGDMSHQDCDSSDLSLGKGKYFFGLKIRGDLRNEAVDQTQWYVCEFDVLYNALSFQDASQPESNPHLIVWELEDYIKRYNKEWKETPEEAKTREEFIERLNKQAQIMKQEQSEKK